MLEYYQELGKILLDDGKTAKAVDCYKKAHMISNSVHGDEHFVTFECLLDLAQLLEKSGSKEEAEQLFKKCLTNFEKKDAKMVKGQEITDELENLSFNSSNCS